jgi:predicted RNA-binding Zn-ribbon protein involved in translation (DUF1610 family)
MSLDHSPSVHKTPVSQVRPLKPHLTAGAYVRSGQHARDAEANAQQIEELYPDSDLSPASILAAQERLGERCAQLAVEQAQLFARWQAWQEELEALEEYGPCDACGEAVDVDGTCTACGLDHSYTCPHCGGRGLHREGCKDIEG